MDKNEKNSHEKVSVIIPTFNRAEKVINCIDSVLKSDHEPIEIIIVDNASTDDTKSKIKNKYFENNKIKLIENEVNLGAGGGRNRGAKKARGEYLLFLDSDNVIHEKMINNLVAFLEENKNCGMVGPIMFFKEKPNVLWTYFADINMYTGRAIYKGSYEKNTGQYKDITKTGHIPNCFMIRNEDFRKIGGFDEKYMIMYEDADIAERVKKRLKKEIFIYSKAITYHDAPIAGRKDSTKTGFGDARIAYLTGRNRIYFMKKNASAWQLAAFLLIFNPLIFIYYQTRLLLNLDIKKSLAYLKGNIDGISGNFSFK